MTFANNTLTPGTTPTANDSIGATDGATTTAVEGQMDGRIAEVGVWGGDIGRKGFLQLSKGFSPLLISPSLLYFYAPLIGKSSPEPDLISDKNGVIIGTIAAAAHPRIIYPPNFR